MALWLLGTRDVHTSNLHLPQAEIEGPSLSASICVSRHHVCRHARDQPLEPTYVYFKTKKLNIAV